MFLTQRTILNVTFVSEPFCHAKMKLSIYAHFVNWIMTKTQFFNYDMSFERHALFRYVKKLYRNKNLDDVFGVVTTFYLDRKALPK